MLSVCIHIQIYTNQHGSICYSQEILLEKNTHTNRQPEKPHAHRLTLGFSGEEYLNSSRGVGREPLANSSTSGVEMKIHRSSNSTRHVYGEEKSHRQTMDLLRNGMGTRMLANAVKHASFAWYLNGVLNGERGRSHSLTCG